MKSVEELLLKKLSNPGKEKEINDEVNFLTRNIYKKTSKIKSPLYLMADILKEEASEILGYKLTFDQEEVFNAMQSKEENNLFVVSDTSFGKTWLCGLSFKENIVKNKEKNIYIHLVPENILTIQGILEIKGLLNDDNIYVSDTIDEDEDTQYIFCTPEMFFNQFDVFEKNIAFISKIIFDEAHMMGEKHIRAEFYTFILSKISECKKRFSAKFDFWFLSAFIPNLNEFINEIKFTEKYELLKPKGFKSRFIIKDNNLNIFLPNKVISSRGVQTKNNGVTLHFFRTSDEARKEYEKIHINRSDIFKYSKDFALNKNKKEIEKIIDDLMERYSMSKNKAHKGYDVLQKIRLGVVLYHAKTPQKIREAIVKLSKLGFINKIYSTSAIIGGVNLKIDNIIIHEAKINQDEFSVSTFLNLSGRAGRFSRNEEISLGVVEFKDNSENNAWIQKNKKNFYGRRATRLSYLEKEKEWYVNESIACSKTNKEKESWYLIDPRINPVSVDLILKNKEEFSLKVQNFVVFLKETLKKGGEKLNWSDAKEGEPKWEDRYEAIEIVKELFDFYKDTALPREWSFHNTKENNKGKIKAIRKYFERFFYLTDDSMFEGTHWWILNKYTGSEKGGTIYFENEVKLYNDQTKYRFSLIINHAVKTYEKINQLDLGLDILFKNKICDPKLYKKIKKEGLLKDYLKWITKRKKTAIKNEQEIEKWLKMNSKKNK